MAENLNRTPRQIRQDRGLLGADEMATELILRIKKDGRAITHGNWVRYILSRSGAEGDVLTFAHQISPADLNGTASARLKPALVVVHSGPIDVLRSLHFGVDNNNRTGERLSVNTWKDMEPSAVGAVRYLAVLAMRSLEEPHVTAMHQFFEPAPNHASPSAERIDYFGNVIGERLGTLDLVADVMVPIEPRNVDAMAYMAPR